MKDEGQKLFEDINLQYIEPLEGGEEESEEQDDGTYRKYLNNVKEELNQKKENIVFVQDLALSNNRLDINEIFDKIKKKSRLKDRNSFLSVYKTKNEEISPHIEKQKPKNIMKQKRPLGFKAIKSLIMTKVELKKYLKNGKRLLTYDNTKNFNNYYKIKHTLLNIRERKKALRKYKSQKIFKKVKKGQIIDDSEEDIFGNKKKNRIKDSLSLLDSSKKESKILHENKSKVEIKPKIIEKKAEEEKKDEENKNKNDNKDEKIKKINPKAKKNKKQTISQQKKKSIYPKKNYNYFLNRTKFYRTKGSNQFNFININKLTTSKNKLKSPAINSILNDINDLSKSILSNDNKKHKDKKNKTILYDKHFGYEYWKENEIIKNKCHNVISNRKCKSYRGFYSPKNEKSNFSIMSSNFSWLYNQKNTEDIVDYETDFTSGANTLNPYSINWTKHMIQNSYNRKIKLNNKSLVPKIELVRVQSSLTNRKREKIKYNNSKINNELFRKTSNNMFGRIYKNNEIEFPVIKNL